MSLSRREWITTVGTAAGMSLLGGFALADEGTAPAPLPQDLKPAPNSDPLLDLVDQAIAITSRRRMVVGMNTPWQVVHGILALRQDMMMVKPEGGEISAIDWMASGAPWRGESIFKVTPYGGQGHPFAERFKYHFEGHPTQFLGYMCEADMPLDFEFQADTKKITVADIINDAKMQISEGPEVTWTLWALSHYLDSNHEWVNAKGESWNIEKMVRIEYQQSVLNSACGGTHGLYALAYSRNKRLSQKLPLSGYWVYGDMKVKRYIQEAKSLQNRDGSFSAAYFKGPQLAQDFATRLPANGHTLEFLMCALPESELKQQWVRRGVESVANDLIINRRMECDWGPLAHALHALKMYNFRVNPNIKSYTERPSIQVVKEPGKGVITAPPAPEEIISSKPGDSTPK